MQTITYRLALGPAGNQRHTSRQTYKQSDRRSGDYPNETVFLSYFSIIIVYILTCLYTCTTRITYTLDKKFNVK
jgi:hypothetical protein